MRRFLLDFLPAKKAPANDGAMVPEFEKPDWIEQLEDCEESLEVARRANDLASLAARTAEEKAARLVQTALALLTISIALAAFQLDFALERSPAWLISLVPVTLSTVFLAISAFEALQVDRVGFYRYAALGDLISTDGKSGLVAVLKSEEHGRQLAIWTSNRKHTDLMQARSWFTRGLLSLIVAGLLAALSVGLDIGSDSPQELLVAQVDNRIPA